MNHTPTADPSWMEQRLMAHCLELLRGGTQPTLPLLGNYCIDKLGLQMRVGGRMAGGLLWVGREGVGAGGCRRSRDRCLVRPASLLPMPTLVPGPDSALPAALPPHRAASSPS